MRILFLTPLIFLGTALGGQPAPSQPEGSAAISQSLPQPRDRAALMQQLGINRPQPDDGLLPPDEAFGATAMATDSATVDVTLTPARGYYLYRDKTTFALRNSGSNAIEAVDLPPGEVKADPYFGSTQVYRAPVQARIHLTPDAVAKRAVTLTASYQGCSEEKKVCYPPISRHFDITLADAAGTAGSDTTQGSNVNAGQSESSTPQSESGRIASLMRNSHTGLVLASFFGFGLLLSLTPCVLPMIPILSGIIVGQTGRGTRSRGLLLSSGYVLGMSVTYALAGIAAGLSGGLISTALQNAWVLSAFAALFVLLALSMFGLYELQLPQALQNRVVSATNRIGGGSVFAVATMGALSALIVSPCVTAPLAGALLYIGQSHNWVLGGAALFVMALGMGVPLMLVGISAEALLPRVGAWMHTVERFFGFVLLGVAIWVVTPVIPTIVAVFLWAALAAFAAIYLLGALDPLTSAPSGYARLRKGLGLIALVGALALVAAAVVGERLQPLAGWLAGRVTQDQRGLAFESVTSVAELNQHLQKAAGRYAMLDFYADWCVSCKEMERFTFRDPRVQAKLRNAVLLRADVTANTAEQQALLHRFSLIGPPGIIFFDRSGREIDRLRIIGYQPAETFLAGLDNAVCC